MVKARITTEPVDVGILGDKLEFRNGKSARNRFMKAALTERIATYDRKDQKACGIPTERLLNLYDKWGNGGFGMVLTGNVVVDPRHLEYAGNAIIAPEIYTKEHETQYKRWAETIKQDGALAIMQINHPGRQVLAMINPNPRSASNVQLLVNGQFVGFGRPIALSLDEIKTQVIVRFVHAAVKAYEAGFDGVQLHAAHGYLLSQFMSPTTNKRNDKYGGPPENRVRLLMDIYHGIREKVPSSTGFLIGVKMNSVEFQDQGLQSDDAKIMCQMMEDAGFDFVEMSGGTLEKLAFHHQRESTKAREGFFLEFTDKLRPVFKNTVLYVTGGFRTAQGMVDAVKKNCTDGIGLGRPITAEPDLPKKILSGAVLSANASLFKQDDFGLTLSASNSQMWQLGAEPAKPDVDLTTGVADFSDEVEAENYLRVLEEYKKESEALAQRGEIVVGVLEYVNVVAN